MTEQHVSRMATLLSKGQLLIPRLKARPGVPGTPQIYHNGLGQFFVGREVIDTKQQIRIAYAPDPERVLELAATRIRRNRFGDPKYDQDQTFPVTRRLAYAAFPELRPKNQPLATTEEERLYAQQQAHFEARARQQDLPIDER